MASTVNRRRFRREGTTTQLAASAHARQLQYDTTLDQMKYLKNDGTTLRHLLTLDENQMALSDLNMGDGKEITVGTVTVSGNLLATKSIVDIFGFGTIETNNIVNGVITPTKSRIGVVGYDWAPDNLDTIVATNFSDGDIIILENTTGESANITITASGNIITNIAGGMVIKAKNRIILMLKADGSWYTVPDLTD